MSELQGMLDRVAADVAAVETDIIATRELDAGALVSIEPHVDREPTVDVWIAYGLRKRWRVVSLGHTYGEWDELVQAERFINLLVDGNPDLRRLR